jgi:hypothetical protein
VSCEIWEKRKTYVAHVERDLEIVYEAVVEFWEEVEDIQDVVTCDFVQVAVG